TNPVGNAYGPGFTGQSKGWVEETVDLTPYAGQRILLRFEVVTDDAINYPGFAVDDIRLAPVGFADGAETDEGGWTAAGFFRTDNRLPQRFIVQAIFFPPEGLPVVRPMPLAEDNSGRLEWDAPLQKTVLVISAQAPLTTVPATYRYAIVPLNAETR
ncbi:MAG: hypothetical protein D6796_14265, partial [Caldilineae bacterium]